MSWSDSPWGPWSKPVTVIPNTGADLNLSPVIRKDGSMVALVRKYDDAYSMGMGVHYGVSRVVTAYASDWKNSSSYVLHNTRDIFANSSLRGSTEDPWLFQAPNGRFHALFHNMYGCFACCGHAFADLPESDTSVERFADLNWTYTGADACGPSVKQQDGSTMVLGRRERSASLDVVVDLSIAQAAPISKTYERY